MYFAVQNYPPQNPRPYDDTGWTFQYMRNVKITPVSDKSVFDAADDACHRAGQGRRRHRGHGQHADRRAHRRQQRSSRSASRTPSVKMQAAEDDFEASGRKFRAGAIIVANADRATLEPIAAAIWDSRDGPWPRRRR